MSDQKYQFVAFQAKELPERTLALVPIDCDPEEFIPEVTGLTEVEIMDEDSGWTGKRCQHPNLRLMGNIWVCPDCGAEFDDDIYER